MSVRGSLVVVVAAVLLAGCAAGPGPQTTTAPGTTAADAATPGTDRPSATPSPGANGTLELHFLNVGQGDSVLVVGPTGETMLVDSGDWRDDGEHVISYLERRGIERIDYLVTTHADADHVGGHAAVIEHFETEGEGVGAVYDPGYPASTEVYQRYLDAVERHDVDLFQTMAGDSIPMAGAEVSVLAPPQPERALAGGERNANSVVLRVTHGATSALLTGDAERVTESFLAEKYGDRLNSTVLKVGHHGSDTSTGEAFLAATSPGIAVISSAYDSRFGHPDPAVLDRLAARSIATLWTATHGDVVLRSDGRSVTVLTQRAAPTDPADLRSADPVAPGSSDPLEARFTVPVGGGGAGTPPSTAPPATDAPVADGGVALEATVRADPPGDDRSNLAGEYVTLRNTGERAVDLSGWTVADAAGHRYVVPDGVRLAPGESIRVRTGEGTDTDSDLYWGVGGPVWNNDGDTVVVTDANGDRVLEVTYP